METYDKAYDLLTTKTNALWSVAPEASVFEALQLIAAKDIGAVLVIHNDQLLGVFSEREYARNVALQGKDTIRTKVTDVMFRPPLTITPETKIDEAMRLMTDHHVRHLPVVSGRTVVGIVSIGDVVKWIMSVQKQTIEHLHCYISGQYDTLFMSA